MGTGKVRYTVMGRCIPVPLVCLGLLLLGCNEPESNAPGPAQTSPNARIAPAPLLSGKSLVMRPSASAATTLGVASEPTARPAPSPYSMFAAPAGDVALAQAEAGVQLEAEFTWPGRTRAAQLYGLEPDEVTQLRASLARSLTIELTTTDRMRLQLASNGFPFPESTSFLARRDREGYLLLWPDETTFRIVPSSALRALFRERRLDVTPTLAASVEVAKKGSRFELPTEVLKVQTAHGELDLEQGRAAGLGASGGLLCGFLLEFIAASTEGVCRDDAVPLRAHFKFNPSGELTFSVKTLKRREDSASLPVLVPPPGAQLVRSGLPEREVGLLGGARRSALKPESADPVVALSLQNPGPLAGYVLIDDTPIAYLGPRAVARLDGFRRGDYPISSLSWFGEPLEPPTPTPLPGRFVAAPPLPMGDAGAP